MNGLDRSEIIGLMQGCQRNEAPQLVDDFIGPAIRRAVLERSAWLGFALDETANEENATTITASASKLPAYVIPTNEELMIAQHAVRLMRASQAR